MTDGSHQTVRRFARSLNLLVTSLVDFVFPARCPLCFRPTQSSDPHALCSPCLSKVTFISPPFCTKCGIPFTSRTEKSHLCGRCLIEETSYGRARAVCTFGGSAKTAIHTFKYQNKTYLAKTLIGLLEMSPVQFTIDHYDCLLAVPLHKNRLRDRGYNQSLLLVREISHRCGVPVDDRLLERTRDSAAQTGLTGPERRENVKGVFSLGASPVGKTILLVDDVFTTGATVNECAEVLLRGGAEKIDVLTVARAV